MKQHVDDACAVLGLLRAQVVDAACDDPASLIVPHLVMPLIKERLEAKAEEAQVGQVQKHVCSDHQPPWHVQLTP